MFKIESYKKGVVLSTFLNIIVKGISFVNTLIIAFYFGANSDTDIYFYLLAVIALVTSTINGIDYYVIVPEAMKIKVKNGDLAAQKFINFFFYSYLIIGSLFFLSIIIAPISFYTLFSKYDATLLKTNYKILYVGGVIILCQLMNNFLSAILVSLKYFTIAIYSALINSLFSIFFTIILHKQLGLFGTTLGIAIGYIINLVLLLYIFKRYQNWNFGVITIIKDARIWMNIGLMQINILPVWIRNYISIYFLSGMGVGVLTSFNLAQMIASIPEIFLLTQVVSIVGIKFSELAAKGDLYETNILLVNTLKTLFLIIIPVTLVMVIASNEFVNVVFERGNFGKGSIETTSFCFFYFSLLIPSKIFDVLFSRLFTSFQLYGLSTVFAVVSHSIIAGLLYLLTLHFELFGYFISMIIGYYLIMPIAFLLIIKIKMPSIQIAVIIKDIIVIFCSAGLIYFGAKYLYDFFNINVYLKIALLCLLVIMLFFPLVNRLLDLQYQKIILKNLLRKYYK